MDRTPLVKYTTTFSKKLRGKKLPSNVVVFSENYKHQEACFFLLFKEGKPYDVVPVKTSDTLKTCLSGWERYSIAPLFLPNPVKVRKEYWERYRQGAGRNPYARLGLAKEFGILKDEAILKLKVLVLDIDSPYEEVLPVWNELKEKLGIEKGYWLVKTKSGNFRAYLFLEPTFYFLTYKEVVDGEVKEKTVAYKFWLRPEGKGRNGKTHLENTRELLHIIYAFFERRGLKADRTFPNRINHPVWVEGWNINGRKSEVKEAKEGYAGKLYDLYRRAKKLQKEENLWTFGSLNLTQRFWPEKLKVVPKFVAKKQIRELDELTKWKLAVAKLAETYDSYRFCNVMLPAVGWALWLGIPREEVESYLREVIPDKRNFDEDIEKAFNTAEPIPFKWEGKELRTEDLVRKFLTRAKEGVARQSLLREVFQGRNYLLQKIERYLLEKGLVYRRAEKLRKGRGRKAYIYHLTEHGEAFLKALEEEKGLRETHRLRKVVGGKGIVESLNINENKKSIYNSLLMGATEWAGGGWKEWGGHHGQRDVVARDVWGLMKNESLDVDAKVDEELLKVPLRPANVGQTVKKELVGIPTNTYTPIFPSTPSPKLLLRSAIESLKEVHVVQKRGLCSSKSTCSSKPTKRDQMCNEKVPFLQQDPVFLNRGEGVL